MAESTLQKLVEEAVRTHVAPGIAYAVGNSTNFTLGCTGAFTYEPDASPVTPTTLWDLASLTKVVGTTTVAMVLYDSHALDLDMPASELLPELRGLGREKIKIRHLFLHNSGLPATFRPDQLGDVHAAMAGQPLVYETGTDRIYSDVGFIALGWILERATGMDLPSLFQRKAFNRLGMSSTCYCPAPEKRAVCAPTEVVDGVVLQGRVHDPTAAAMGGIAGHAGLFSTLADMIKFGSEQLIYGRNLYSPETVDDFLDPNLWGDFTGQYPDADTLALGWQSNTPGSSAGELFGAYSYGHTGFTGTSIWVDLEADLCAILLTNRVHPTASNLKIRDFRIAFHNAAAMEFGKAPKQV